MQARCTASTVCMFIYQNIDGWIITISGSFLNYRIMKKMCTSLSFRNEVKTSRATDKIYILAWTRLPNAGTTNAELIRCKQIILNLIWIIWIIVTEPGLSRLDWGIFVFISYQIKGIYILINQEIISFSNCTICFQTLDGSQYLLSELMPSTTHTAKCTNINSGINTPGVYYSWLPQTFLSNWTVCIHSISMPISVSSLIYQVSLASIQFI